MNETQRIAYLKKVLAMLRARKQKALVLQEKTSSGKSNNQTAQGEPVET